MGMTLPSPLRGIIPPLPTPLLAPDKLDVEGLDRLIGYVLAGGVHGLFLLGSTGEGPSLSPRLRRELIRHACRITRGRVPVLTGITDTSAEESVSLAQFAADAGADAVVVAAPCYFRTTQVELLEHIRRLVPRLTLPVLLYNIPIFTGNAFEIPTVMEAAKLPGVIGFKDSSGDMIAYHRMRLALSGRPGFSLLVGSEELLADAVLLGGHGSVAGGANLDPRLYVDLYEAAMAGKLAEVRLLHDRVLRLATGIYRVGSYGAGFLKGIKCALSLMGICGEALAEPYVPLDGEHREHIRARLEEMGLLGVTVR